MKKIAFFMHNFNGGGAEKVTLKLAEELKRKGYDVTLVMRETIGELSNSVPNGINVIDLKINQKSKIIKNILNIVRLKNILKKNKYDILYSVTFNMSVIAGVTKSLSRTKVKLYAVLHNTISKEKNKLFKIKRFIMKIVEDEIEKIIFVSEGARKDYINNMSCKEEKTITIYNPVVSDEIKKKCLEEFDCDWIKSKKDYSILLNIGRLTEQKNQELLLDAMKLLKEKKKVKLIILGEGELREKLEKRANDNEISESVLFYGFTRNPYALLKNSDLLVLSSNYEGLPTVLIEALACGCNVVSTDCPTGPKEILDNGKYGKLVKVNDAQELAKGIIEKLDRGMIESKILEERAQDFSVEKSVNKYIELMEG